MLSVLTLTSVIPLGFFKNKGVGVEGKRATEGEKREKEGGRKKNGGNGDVQTNFYFHNSIIGQFKEKEGGV